MFSETITLIQGYKLQIFSMFVTVIMMTRYDKLYVNDVPIFFNVGILLYGYDTL